VIDTSPSADARYHELLRALPPERRLETAMKLSRAVRELAISGIRQRHPDADEREVRVRLAVRLYGSDVATRLFGTVPDDAV
jgi:DNA-binding HxlR family transcriptional regulator